MTRQLVPEKFPFPQNQFAAIASALASLENCNEVDEWNPCLAGINCSNINIFKGSKASIFCQSPLLRLVSRPHYTRPSAPKINCTILRLFHGVYGYQLFKGPIIKYEGGGGGAGRFSFVLGNIFGGYFRTIK